MAQSNFHVSLHRRTALLVSFISLSVILMVAFDINAQTRKRNTSRSKQPTCDDLAAHPEDKGRIGTGVADESIVPTPAIEKCALAVRRSPKVARFYFQLGRAHWAAKSYDEALAAFLKAEELGYAPAYFYLGLAYEQGFIKGEQANLPAARNLYMIAAAEGFEPAARAYAGFEEVYEINFEDFAVPPYAQIIYEGKQLTLLNRERMNVLFYIRGMQLFLDRKTNIIDPACAQIYDPQVSAALDEIMDVELIAPQGFFADLARNLSAAENAEARNAGDSDIHRLVVEYGGCLGAPVTQFYGNAKRYLQENPVKKP